MQTHVSSPTLSIHHPDIIPHTHDKCSPVEVQLLKARQQRRQPPQALLLPAQESGQDAGSVACEEGVGEPQSLEGCVQAAVARALVGIPARDGQWFLCARACVCDRSLGLNGAISRRSDDAEGENQIERPPLIALPLSPSAAFRGRYPASPPSPAPVPSGSGTPRRAAHPPNGQPRRWGRTVQGWMDVWTWMEVVEY